LSSDIQIFSADSNVFANDGGIVSMLTEDEKALYFNLAAGYQNRGRVVEIGPWLGSGTYQICAGLKQTGLPWALTVFDRFQWSQLYTDRYPHVGLSADESFRPIFERNLSEFVGTIDFVTGELLELSTLMPLPDDAAIELLFIDAPKSWRLLWSVLAHFGPHLMPGSRLAFQDFFHITSRQIIWLLASIPGFRLTALVDNGTSAVFVADGPIPDLAGIVRSSMNELGAADLMRLWRRLATEMPKSRLGDLAAGMALDLMERGAFAEAKAVLDEGAVGQSWSADLLREVERLARVGDAKSRPMLAIIASYLKTGISPAEFEADRRRRVAASDRDRRPTSPIDGLDRAGLLAALSAIREPASTSAIALAYQAARPDADLATVRALLPAFDLVVQSGAPIWAREIAADVVGRDVVEIGGGLTLHGLMLRALGARSHVAIEPAFTPDQRSVRGDHPVARLRAKQPLSAIAAIDGGMRYTDRALHVANGSADLIIVHAREAEEVTSGLAEARRILRADGRLVLFWSNPLAWRGHGLSPQNLDEVEPGNLAHMNRADWAHVGRAVRTALRIERLDGIVTNAGFVVQEVQRLPDDPAILARLTGRVLRRAPEGIAPADLAVAQVKIVAEVTPS
jgi:SAM-dependent methyltransferase